jgi:hypothetical protein
MRDFRHPAVITLLLLALFEGGSLFLGIRTALAQAPEGEEVLTRGPVHEAFAELINSDVQPGMVVPDPPPAPIEEIPPEEKPEGDNVVWIPGYWAWDEDRTNFLWISGIWRIPPPNSNWVPGYWVQVDGGYQWIAGFWLPNEIEEVNYLPAPPANIDEGPTGPPPSPEQTWVSGNWVWPADHYVWQPGFWVEPRPDWVYIPAHYIWTPGGCIFVAGYWDYPIDYRGVLFAPVYYSQPVYLQPAYTYCPSVFIDVGILTSHLFCHPHYSHYCFGDYYGDSYAHIGIVPWFDFHYSHHCDDPIFAHEHFIHGHHDSHWDDTLRVNFQLRKDKPDLRPLKVFDDPKAIAQAHPEASPGKTLGLGKKFQDFGKGKESPLNLVKIDQAKRDNLGKVGKDLQNFTKDRVKLETVDQKQKGMDLSKGQTTNKIEKLKIQKSPITDVLSTNKNTTGTTGTDLNINKDILKGKGGHGDGAQLLEGQPGQSAGKGKPKLDVIKTPDVKNAGQNQDASKNKFQRGKNLQNIQLPKGGQGTIDASQDSSNTGSAGNDVKNKKFNRNLNQNTLQKNQGNPIIQTPGGAGSTGPPPSGKFQKNTLQKNQGLSNQLNQNQTGQTPQSQIQGTKSQKNFGQQQNFNQQNIQNLNQPKGNQFKQNAQTFNPQNTQNFNQQNMQNFSQPKGNQFKQNTQTFNQQNMQNLNQPKGNQFKQNTQFTPPSNFQPRGGVPKGMPQMNNKVMNVQPPNGQIQIQDPNDKHKN